MQAQLDILKALADESRLRAFMALRGGELCVCQLIELLALAPSTVSKHLFILRQAGLVTARKQGRWIYYRLSAEDSRVCECVQWLDGLLTDNPRLAQDARSLERIRGCDLEQLCRLQYQK